MKISRIFHRARFLAATTLGLTSLGSAVLRAQDASGGLGAVSKCDAAPQIAAAASTFVVSQSGLSPSQANAALSAAVQQACRSAPNASAQIAQQAITAIAQQSSSAQASAAGGAGAGTVSTAAIQSIVQGAIQGCAAAGMTAGDL
jgi:hypothetical protein